MHSVAPVNVYVQNHVKHPIVATCLIEEPTKLISKKSSSSASFKLLTKSKSEQQSKKTSSQKLTAPNTKNIPTRTRSFSPKSINKSSKNDDQFISHKRESRLEEFNLPEKDESSVNNSTLNEAMNDAINKLNKEETKPSQSYSFFSNLLNNQRNKVKFQDDDKQVNDTFTRCNTIENVHVTHDNLLQKLFECDLIGGNIAKQLSSLKDFLKLICNENQINSLTSKKLENDRDELIKNLEQYEIQSQELKTILNGLKVMEQNDSRRNQSQDVLIKKIDTLETENNHLKRLLLDMEKNILRLSDENDHFKLENSALCNLKLSLEQNRAHLRKELMLKESDANRTSVQLRNTERKYDQLKIELHALKESYSQLQEQKSTINKKPSTQKKQLDVKDLEIKNLIERLQNDGKEKDAIISELLKTKSHENQVDENEFNKIKKELEVANNLIMELKQRKYEHKCDTQQQSTNDSQNQTNQEYELKRMKHFNELELDKVRQKLQKRLNELEPLPELLKNTELKLHESLKRQKEQENKMQEYVKCINELKHMVKNPSSTTLSSSTQFQPISIITSDSSLTTANNNNDAERRIKMLENENHDLFRQLSLKEDALRDSSNRLTNKTNEATSLERQLELLIQEYKQKEENLRERLNTKEKNVQSRMIELETQLSKLKLDYNTQKRDREENEYRYQSQLKDVQDRLEQSYATNKSMQNYVNFLKNSYSTVFNDNLLSNVILSPASPF